jgi:hypothetical protein
MIRRCTAVFLAAAAISQAVIVDRIAIIAGKRVIKDSDIAQDLRITAFLNHELPQFTPEARKKAADRLIDQTVIRIEIEQGDYPIPSIDEAKAFLANIKKPRFASEGSYQRTLVADQINEQDLLQRLLWQMTVLRFVDARFRPAVRLTDEEVQAYATQHKQTLDEGRNALTAQAVDKALDAWLTSRRKALNLVYKEEELK